MAQGLWVVFFSLEEQPSQRSGSLTNLDLVLAHQSVKLVQALT